jgi:hypothetical protein
MRQVESGGALPWVKGEHVAAGEQVEVPGTQPSCGGVGEEGHDAVLRQLMTAQLADPEAEAQGLTIELVSTHQRQFEGLSREQKRARVRAGSGGAGGRASGCPNVQSLCGRPAALAAAVLACHAGLGSMPVCVAFTQPALSLPPRNPLAA